MYAAPEIIRKKNYDGQMADIWSLGIQKFILFVVYFYFCFIFRLFLFIFISCDRCDVVHDGDWSSPLEAL